MRSLYVALARLLRTALTTTGVVRLLETRSDRSRAALWARSLLAIYDLPALVRLDVPWWTFKASDEVQRFLRQRPDARVFEWGSGASTVWLAKRAASVVSVEHDASWAEAVRPWLPDNATLLVVRPDTLGGSGGVPSGKRGFEGLDFTDYVAAINRAEGPFDLIVVDGRAREACLARALPHLSPEGIVVFDNAARRRYRSALDAVDGGRVVRWTRGLTPCLPYPDTTALVTSGATSRR